MTKKNIIKTLALTLSISLLAPLFADKAYAKESAPSIVSESAIVMDYETGEIIYEKNANEKKYLASTTKLMSALLLAENKQKTDMLTYTQTAKNQPPYTVDNDQMKPHGKEMKVGDQLSADVVMKELLLFSGNDIAYMLADGVGGDSDTFVKMMNDKAKELGLNNTHFENPNGLPKNLPDGTQVETNYSTAYELALLTKAAYSNEWVRETVGLSKTRVVLPGDTIIDIENRNSELGKNGNVGGKTGVTNGAGTTFSGVYERDGRKLIGSVLKCDRNNNETRFEDLNKIMTYSYAQKEEAFKSSGDEVGSVDLEYKLFKFFGPVKTITAPVTLAQDVMLYDNSINNTAEITISAEMNDAWKAASSKEVPLTLSILNLNEEIKGTVALSTFDIVKANMFVYIAVLVAILVVITLIYFIIKLLSNKNRGSMNRKRRRRY